MERRLHIRSAANKRWLLTGSIESFIQNSRTMHLSPPRRLKLVKFAILTMELNSL